MTKRKCLSNEEHNKDNTEGREAMKTDRRITHEGGMMVVRIGDLRGRSEAEIRLKLDTEE